MNKKIIASVSALVLCTSSIFTVSAATTAKKPSVSAAMQTLQDQLKAANKSKNDIVKQAKQSDAYKQLETQTLTIEEKIIDQEVTDGKITANQAAVLKDQLESSAKVKNDTTLQDLLKNIVTYQSDLKTLKQKYTTNATLIASQDFKDLKAKVVTNAKAIVDRYAADGAITSATATQQKTNIDTISTNIDNGKDTLTRLFNTFTTKTIGFNGKNFNMKNFNMKNFKGKGFANAFGKGFKAPSVKGKKPAASNSASSANKTSSTSAVAAGNPSSL